MATPQAQRPPAQPSSTTTTTSSDNTFVYPDWIVYSCGAVVVLGPIALFTPPRRAGVQSIFIAGATSYASSVLMYHYTGASLYQRFVRRWQSMVGNDSLPEKAQQTRELLRRQRERREAALLLEEQRRLRDEREKARGPLEKLWVGNEKENWREERRKKEEEALAEGKGYGDLILEHIKEAFGSKKNDVDKGEAKNDENKKP